MKEKTKVIQPTADGTTTIYPPPPPQKHYDIYMKVTGTDNSIYTNQTGKLPVTSGRGHTYPMIMCELDRNSIVS